jgi:hypothetical protein
VFLAGIVVWQNSMDGLVRATAHRVEWSLLSTVAYELLGLSNPLESSRPPLGGRPLAVFGYLAKIRVSCLFLAFQIPSCAKPQLRRSLLPPVVALSLLGQNGIAGRERGVTGPEIVGGFSSLCVKINVINMAIHTVC